MNKTMVEMIKIAVDAILQLKDKINRQTNVNIILNICP